MGDKVLAYWNIRTTRSDHNLLCVNAAQELLRATQQLGLGVRLACTSGYVWLRVDFLIVLVKESASFLAWSRMRVFMCMLVCLCVCVRARARADGCARRPGIETGYSSPVRQLSMSIALYFWGMGKIILTSYLI